MVRPQIARTILLLAIAGCDGALRVRGTTPPAITKDTPCSLELEDRPAPWNKRKVVYQFEELFTVSPLPGRYTVLLSCPNYQPVRVTGWSKTFQLPTPSPLPK